MRLFVAVLLIGMVGSLLTNMPSMPSSSTSTNHVVDAEVDTATDDAAAAPTLVMNMDGAVQLERKADGHFYADVEINGTVVTMLVDTGASGIALSREDARKAGIPTSIGMNQVVGRGADGAVHGERPRDHLLGADNLGDADNGRLTELVGRRNAQTLERTQPVVSR